MNVHFPMSVDLAQRVTTCLLTRCARGAARLVPCDSLRRRGASGKGGGRGGGVLTHHPYTRGVKTVQIFELQPIMRK
jgi:hypothetical protein